MTTFNTRFSLQYLDAAGAAGFENDGEPVYDPSGGDYTADVPTGARVRHPMVTTLGVIVGQVLFYNPSPFTLIREIDPNIFPATRPGFNGGFD